jgi:hypothetical protein
MITPQEKAKEIIKKFIPHAQYWDCYNDELLKKNHAKQCALIAVEEIIDLNLGLSNCDENNWSIEKFYIEVKQEIQKL